MIRYLLRRILLFIPTVLVISLVAFAILVNSPGDPVDRMMMISGNDGAQTARSAQIDEERQNWRERLGLDLPVFYVSVTSYASPDTLHRIVDKEERHSLGRLIREYGNWAEIQEYYRSYRKLIEELISEETPDPDAIALARNFSASGKRREVEKIISALEGHLSGTSRYSSSFNKVKDNWEEVIAQSSSWKNWIPSFHFHGNNQYHRWLFGDGDWLTGAGSLYSKGILRGDFGLSYLTREPVLDKIGRKLFWSVLLSFISVLLAYSISLPLGVFAASRSNTRIDRFIAVILFLLYALPSFWVATLLLMVFSNPDWLLWFPASGVKPPEGFSEDAGFWQKMVVTLPYLVLPTIAYTYSSLAFLSRTLRVSMMEILRLDFIRTARAKGLPESKVLWRHAFRNALLPVITLLANVFPAALGGAVILESIFSIPGMGFEIYRAILNQDYPLLVAVFTLVGLVTVISYLLADILYSWADPRIRFSKGK